MAGLSEIATQLVAEAVGAATDVLRFGQDLKQEVMNLVAVEVLQEAGLEIEQGSPLTARVIADALSAKIESDYGITTGDLLDADSVRSTLRREAVRMAGDALGVGGTQAEIAAALRSAVVAQVREAAASQEPDFLAAVAVGASRAAELARAAEANEWPTPISNNSAAGERNRSKQAIYRSRHKRVWIPK